MSICFYLSNLIFPNFLLSILKKISEAIVCIAFPFFIDTSRWDLWSYMNGIYFFYLSTAAIACGVSIILYIIHCVRAYRSLLSNWTKSLEQSWPKWVNLIWIETQSGTLVIKFDASYFLLHLLLLVFFEIFNFLL